MKTDHKGVIILVLVALIALIIGVGGTYLYLKPLSTSQKISETQDIPTTPSLQKLSDSDILKATYTLHSNFDGIKSPGSNVVFDSYSGSGTRLSGVAYINKEGIVFGNSIHEPTEGFWISDYSFNDSSYTEATVTITGNFGASGKEEYFFVVTKVNNQVTTKEVFSKPQNDNWKIQTNAQYRYQISYPLDSTLQTLKIRPEIAVEDDSKTAACKTNQSMPDAEITTINDVDFYVTPLDSNGGEFITIYTTIKNNLCYQILYRIGDRKSTRNSPETIKDIEVVKEIMSTFKFI